MRGRYFLKWLFLTVLSVSTLHFREIAGVGPYKTKQVYAVQRVSQRQGLLSLKNLKPAGNRHFAFTCFKNQQHAHLTYLSNELSSSITQHPDFHFTRVPGCVHIQNQHFRSRTRSADPHSIFLS